MEDPKSARSWVGHLQMVIAHLVRVNSNHRTWHLPLIAALATGFPLIFATWHGQLSMGLPAALGGLALLYLPSTPIANSMPRITVCAFGLLASYAVGVLCQQLPNITIPAITMTTLIVAMSCRHFSVPPPGILFFVMAASIAAYTPPHDLQWVTDIAWFALGCVLSVALSFAYSLRHYCSASVAITAPVRNFNFDEVVTDSIIIASTVGLSLVAATLIQLERPYWVPITCAAMFRATTLQTLWIRQAQRIIGTAIGIVLFWIIASLHLNPWGVALAMALLTFTVESLVVRNYGFAVVFLTPYALLMAEAAQTIHLSPITLMQARLIDTIIGSSFGLVGGMCLHISNIRSVVGYLIRRTLNIKILDSS